jgi:hypothetical protein
MRRTISDSDIEAFLLRNAEKHASQLSLIESAVTFLWPEGAPPEEARRVVLAALARPSLGSVPRQARETG